MFGKISEEERQVVFRFNKIFTEHHHALLQRLAAITADHAAKGLLKSGATAKRYNQAMQDELITAIGEALELVSKKTDHAGRKRTRMLDHLRVQVRHAGKYYGDSLAGKVNMVVGASGDANAAFEQLRRDSLKRALDEVDKYDDGLTAPKDVRWHQRHPILTGAVAALITAIVGTIVVALSGLI
jgi:hypothetical protein